MKVLALFLSVSPFLVATVSALATPATTTSPPTTTSSTPKHGMFDYLKWNGATPDFDVLQKTKDYTAFFESGQAPPEEMYWEDYVLRGPVIGPTNLKDLRETQKGFDYNTAFPDLSIESFGYSIDPENPFRCFYFQRWKGTHKGTLQAGSQAFEATGDYCETPVSVFCVVWTPDQKIAYEQVGAPVDRFEGTTKGKAAVFGLFHTAGLKIPAAPGSLVLRFFQRLGHALGNGGRSYSKEEDIPGWWTSKSRGADPTD